MFATAIGYAPTVVVSNIRPPEKEIYEQLWDKPQYRYHANGEAGAHNFLEVVKPKKGASVLDLGCGTGRGGLYLAMFGAMNVTLVDFASNCLDEDIKDMLVSQPHALRFIEADLTKALPVQAEYGFCTDVMEHIPPGQVDDVLDHCLKAARHCFFQICLVEDRMGLIDHPLHLTVKPFEWWAQKFNERGCLVHWSHDGGEHCSFYVSAWVDGEAIVDSGVLNTTEELVLENVKKNIEGNWLTLQPHPINDMDIMIVGGGPSLDQHEEEIRQLRKDGVKLIAINGAYKWCIDKGITPSGLVMIDARPFNARFAKPVIDECKYFIASQCDPSVFEGLPEDRTYIWHTTSDHIRAALDEKYKLWWGIPGGSTVLLRAIPLFRMLGFKKFHLFGCDSCIMDNKHHGYSQPENDEKLVVPVSVGGRIFKCHVWMVSQAQEFINLVRYIGEEVELEVHGDGLLKHILQTGADMFDEGVEIASVDNEEVPE